MFTNVWNFTSRFRNLFDYFECDFFFYVDVWFYEGFLFCSKKKINFKDDYDI